MGLVICSEIKASPTRNQPLILCCVEYVMCLVGEKHGAEGAGEVPVLVVLDALQHRETVVRRPWARVFFVSREQKGDREMAKGGMI